MGKKTTKTADCSDLLTAVAAIGREITASRRRAENKLARVLTIILEYLEAEQGSIMLVERGRLVVWAASRSSLIGLAQEMDGRSVASWVAQHGRPLFIPDITRDKRFAARSADRAYRKNSLLSAPILQNGRVIGVINVTDKAGRRDLHQDDIAYLVEFCGMVVWLLKQQKMAERIRRQKETLRKKNEELKRQERLRDELSQALVHDLKGPLAEVVANLDILSYSVTGEGREFVQAAQVGCDRAVRMVNNLVSVGRLEDGRMRLIIERIQAADLIAEAAAGISSLAAIRGITVETDTGGEALEINADRTMILRVLQNLLTNAIGYSPEGSGIVMGCRRRGRYAEFYVRDHGPGIPPDKMDYIFDKYARINDREDCVVGTGLGLYFCRLAVRAHRGSIGVENTGDGSRFCFRIPLAAEGAR